MRFVFITLFVGMWLWLLYAIMTKSDPRPGSLPPEPLPMEQIGDNWD
jgi:uncharacterized protein with PQ loop repeat